MSDMGYRYVEQTIPVVVMASVRTLAQGIPQDLGHKIATRLAEDLFSGTYRPGDLLPKEIELADTFGISRASVRSGLQTLVSLGMVRRHSGQGTVVTEYRDWNMLDPMVTGWMSEYATPNPEFLREIYEFRRSTEPFIAALAARRATARDLAAIEDAFLAMEQALHGEKGSKSALDLPEFSIADVEFHAAIYRATHNLVWGQLAHILRPSILLVIRKSNDTADELRDSLERHRALMESIRLRQPDAAFDAAVSVMDRTGFDLGLQAGGSTELLP